MRHITLLIALALLVGCLAGSSFLDSLSQFEVVELRHAESARGLFTTKIGERRGVPVHVDATDVTFTAEGKKFHLQLDRNQNLFSADFQHVVYDTNGQIVDRKNLEEVEHCHYLGKVVGEPESTVSLSTCDNSFVGHINIKGVVYHLQNEAQRTIFYRAEHAQVEGHCGTGHEHQIEAQPNPAAHSAFGISHPGSRSVEQAGCSERWLEVGVGYDNQFATRFSNPATEIATVFNQVHAVYWAGGFTPRLGVSVKTIVAYPFTTDKTTGQGTLDAFCPWKVGKFGDSDMVHLLSGNTIFESNLLGLNYIGIACDSSRYGCGFSATSNSRAVTASTVSHEIGHGMGSPHDSGAAGSSCDGNAFIMSPSIKNPPVTSWSSCTKSNVDPRLCPWTCLGNPPTNGPPNGATSVPCTPVAQPCAGACGLQPNGCGQNVDCGPCGAPTLVDAVTFVNRHNYHRANTFPAGYPPDTPLTPLTWSNTLAQNAQAWANTCTKAASPWSARSALNAGENVAWTSNPNQIATAITDFWASKVSLYDYPSNTGAAGVWAQIVWASTTQVGCGVKQCAADATSPNGYYLTVCQYSPPGGYVGQRPYVSTPQPPCKTCADLNVQCGNANPQCSSSTSINCGACPAGETCNNGRCVCIPNADCTGKCGQISNGCGGFVTCPSCGVGRTCNANNLCVCAPKSHAEACGGRTCGSVDDGCGGSITCGNCASNEGCNAGVCECLNNCPCNQQFCPQNNHECGTFVDPACGQARDCGSCPAGETCNNGRCECAPSQDCSSVECGDAFVSDGCGGLNQCSKGACPGNENCVNNQCQPCVPRTCADNGLHCRPSQGFPSNDLDDGCGGVLNCDSVATCPLTADQLPQVCSKAPNVNSYDCAPCIPNQDTCQSLGYTDCGFVDNGCKLFLCGPPENNGNCPSAGTVCQQGRCVCSVPRKTCSEVARECGNFFNGCELESCTHPQAAAGSDCPAGQTCGADGRCVATCTPTACPAGGCGFISDGCGSFIQCGDTCPQGQTCQSGSCVDSDGCVPNCHSLAVCSAGVCSCASGYIGDGVVSCVERPPLTPDLSGWKVFGGDTASQTDWRLEGGALVYSGTSPSTLVWTSTSTDLSNLRATGAAAGTAGLTCNVYNIDSSASLGMRIDEKGNGFHWQFKKDGSTTLILVAGSRTYNGVGSKWTAAANGVNSVRVLFVQIPEKSLVQTFATVNGVNVGGFQFSTKLLPTVGAVYVVAGSAATFDNCFLVTRSTVKITLAKCVGQDEFLQYVADIAKVPKETIAIESYECSSKRSAEELTAVVSFSSTASSSSEAIASQFSASVTQGLNPQAAAGGMTAAQTISFTPELVAGLSTLGAILSVGAIVGIALGGSAVVAGASAGVAVAVKKNKQKKREYEPEAEVEMQKPAKPAPPPRSNVRRTFYKLFSKKPGVNVNVETQNPNEHHSITARAQT